MNFSMIAIPVFNPGIDRILYLNYPTNIGSLNRISKTVVNQGCKGINIAIMLKRLGAEPEYISFTGGIFDDIYRRYTNECGVKSQYKNFECGIRVNTKVIDANGICTEFNEKGGPVSDVEVTDLLDLIYASKAEAFILSGSIPNGVGNDIYADIIRKKKDDGAFTALDCDGELFTKAIKARPDLIKPNRRELAGILDKPESDFDDVKKVIKGASLLKQLYGCDVICTLDEKGSVYYGNDGIYVISAADVKLKGFSGAGDTYLASYIYKKYVDQSDTAEALKFASAAAGAKVALEGTNLPEKDQINACIDSVKVEKLEPEQ